MIQLTRINRTALVLNSDLIEHMEVTPDTVISMTNGQKFMVRESADELISKVIAFRKSICEGVAPCPALATGGVSRAAAASLIKQEEDEDWAPKD
jgi:flagellar protein FlbD